MKRGVREKGEKTERGSSKGECMKEKKGRLEGNQRKGGREGGGGKKKRTSSNILVQTIPSVVVMFQYPFFIQ
jgi:hypothetical protein